MTDISVIATKVKIKAKIKAPAPAPASPTTAPAPVRHIPKFIPADQANSALQVISALIPWATFAPSPRSRKVCQWQLGMSDADSLIYDMKCKLERTENVTVNGIFLNLYQDGNDHCPYHRDQYNMDVYTISLGATRDLLIKPDGSGSTQKITLKSGDLYYMAESLHKDHKHSIPKRAGVHAPRISIVFFTHMA